MVEFVAECRLPTEKGIFNLRSYRCLTNSELNPLVVTYGDVKGKRDILVRVHDQCATSEIFGSLRCDCKDQLDTSLTSIRNVGGVVIYLQQEGRGIGLLNKIKSYEIQDSDLVDTVDANSKLGFATDSRSYSCVRPILENLGIESINLMTNNPLKIKEIISSGIYVSGITYLPASSNPNNIDYLRAKVSKLGHSPFLLTQPVDWTVPNALEQLRIGRPIIVVDDKDRENEGDLIMAAECVTTESIAFIVRNGTGIICVGMKKYRLKELNLPQMVSSNEDPKQTAFTVSVDAKFGISTGVSASDRATTIRLLSHPDSTAAQFSRPGHVFPLRAVEGGILSRKGHTEAAVDLMELSGLRPVGVMCEIQCDDGTMARLAQLIPFALKHSLVLISIAELESYIQNNAMT